MKLIETTAELLPFISGEDGIYKMIERAGRTCYKSTDKMTDDSAKPFVERMIKSGHTAMLEHGTVYLTIPVNEWRDCEHEFLYMFPESLSWVSVDCDGKNFYITTNLRHIIEGNVGMELVEKYYSDPTENHEKRYTFKMVTSIGVTRELNRHRVNSIAEQSTRYCNYAKKDKFGGEISFCIPVFYDDWDSYLKNEFDRQLEKSESMYMWMIEKGLPPQQAREVLPLCTASEIVHTAFASDWRHFFDLRLFAKTGTPHPNMLELAKLMQAEAEKNGIWEDIINQKSKFE